MDYFHSSAAPTFEANRITNRGPNPIGLFPGFYYWAERYQGLLERKTGGATNYDDQANQNLAKNLKGHLLLAHGTVDDNVPPTTLCWWSTRW